MNHAHAHDPTVMESRAFVVPISRHAHSLSVEESPPAASSVVGRNLLSPLVIHPFFGDLARRAALSHSPEAAVIDLREDLTQ
jgi:hypothetical protein